MVTFVGFCLCFLKKYIQKACNLAMKILSNRYLLIQLNFTLNIIVYYSLHSCCFLKRKLKDISLSYKSQRKNDYLATFALFIAKSHASGMQNVSKLNHVYANLQQFFVLNTRLYEELSLVHFVSSRALYSKL